MASPIADRIRAYCAEKGLSRRALSVAATLHPSHVSMVVARLDKGQNVSVDVLQKIAGAMGRPVSWLMAGDESGTEQRLRDLPEWASVAAVARERFKLDPEAVEAVGAWKVPAPAPKIDAVFIAALARAWSDAAGH